MQVDGQVEENDNVEEDQFVVENSSIVSKPLPILYLSNSLIIYIVFYQG